MALVAALASGAAWSEQTTVKGVRWVYEKSDGHVTVAGDCGFNYKGKVTIPAKIDKAPVTRVTGAFGVFPNITEIAFPASVTAIDEGAFANSAIVKVSLPAKLKRIEPMLFQNCRKLKSITLPKGLESIGDEAFEGCESLSSITIPESVTSLGKAVFNGCPKLETVNLGNGNLYGQLSSVNPDVKFVLSAKAKKVVASPAAGKSNPDDAATLPSGEGMETYSFVVTARMSKNLGDMNRSWKESLGASVGWPDGSALSFNPAKSALIVKNTPENLVKIEKVLKTAANGGPVRKTKTER